MSVSKTIQATVEKEVISESPKPRVRDRIFETACDLFYRHGIRAVGVDTIASEAGTNKMSFYRSWASKDELVAEYLRSQESDGWAWWDDIMEAHAGDPRKQVEVLFDGHVKDTCRQESRGCALANAAVEITEPDHPARVVVEKYKAEMRRRFRKLAQDMGAREYEILGDSLMLLWEGSYLSRLTFQCQNGPARNAAKAARGLIEIYTN
ncbi:TetR/AcrR family transcriptional regulator [Stenotrophobium rhamnosiphilum]|uniref:TetR/AcrR family transcriptional regulator n=1 Tax=Stenotrophobium rhamnosiphilum TaxID=2029166 RepID=A0A2T5ME78_9GAMM|nr:TetR/AcrR family transcriptional regulator [Stenotrophobium rhamnosiphilum]PTU30849.1 TetR/AcrR family transcriptional regulator [Stenotrophobium rhamnosiphilum]